MLQLAWCFCAFPQESQHSGENACKILIFEETFQVSTCTLCTVLCGIASSFGGFEQSCLVLYVVNPFLFRCGAGFVLVCSEAVPRPA